MTAKDITESVELFESSIRQAQIIMFPGGFSAGDEPDGSAKFFATAFQNAGIKEAVMDLLYKRDGLALGICNGFQALIKLGLVPYGDIQYEPLIFQFSSMDTLPSASAYCVATCPFAKSLSIHSLEATKRPSP